MWSKRLIVYHFIGSLTFSYFVLSRDQIPNEFLMACKFGYSTIIDTQGRIRWKDDVLPRAAHFATSLCADNFFSLL